MWASDPPSYDLRVGVRVCFKAMKLILFFPKSMARRHCATQPLGPHCPQRQVEPSAARGSECS